MTAMLISAARGSVTPSAPPEPEVFEDTSGLSVVGPPHYTPSFSIEYRYTEPVSGRYVQGPENDQTVYVNVGDALPSVTFSASDSGFIGIGQADGRNADRTASDPGSSPFTISLVEGENVFQVKGYWVDSGPVDFLWRRTLALKDPASYDPDSPAANDLTAWTPTTVAAQALAVGGSDDDAIHAQQVQDSARMALGQIEWREESIVLPNLHSTLGGMQNGYSSTNMFDAIGQMLQLILDWRSGQAPARAAFPTPKLLLEYWSAWLTFYAFLPSSEPLFFPTNSPPPENVSLRTAEPNWRELYL